MTHRNTTIIQCQCGHVGELILEENDSPFSRQYERWYVLGLNSKLFDYQSFGAVSESTALLHLGVSCVKCNGQITGDNIK